MHKSILSPNSLSNSKRIDYIDIAKGFGMLTIVYPDENYFIVNNSQCII